MFNMEDCYEEVYKLDTEKELRFIVPENSQVLLELLSGKAEIFGSELVEKKTYTFKYPSSVSLFTWQGCSVKLSGRTEKVSINSDVLIIIPVSLHASLESMRHIAESEKKTGPVCLVVGPRDVGKTTLCRMLLNYAARLGRKPLVVDLDVGQNSISLPGSVSILPLSGPADVIEGFDDTEVRVYPFGYKSPGHNIAHYFFLVKTLGRIVQSHLKNAPDYTRASGVIIDTCGWVRGLGYEAITLAACSFEIDVLFVIEEQRLYLQLKRDMPNSVEVVYVPKHEAVFDRPRYLRMENRDSRVREYFFGPDTTVGPFSISLNFDDMELFKVKYVTRSAPNTENLSTEDFEMVSVPFEPNLINQVVSLSCSRNFRADLMIINIVGFVCITNVDMSGKIATVLSPQPGPLPGKIFLMGDIRLRR